MVARNKLLCIVSGVEIVPPTGNTARAITLRWCERGCKEKRGHH